MSYIHHIFDFIIFPFYAQYFQRFIYIFSKTYNSHLVILYISHNSFSKKGDTFLLNLCIFRKKGYFFNKKSINTKDLLTFVFIVHLTF